MVDVPTPSTNGGRYHLQNATAEPKSKQSDTVGECPNRAYKGPFTDFLAATDEAIDYVQCLDVRL